MLKCRHPGSALGGVRLRHVLCRRYASEMPHRHKPKSLSKSVRGADASKLKYNPTDTNADFKAFGIVPFLQSTINRMHSTSEPPSYILPTPDQRSLLSTLGSACSVIMRGAGTTGKTLALICYALNVTFSRTPAYSLVELKPRVDSILIVPTDSLVLKYKSMIEKLLKDVPPECCPNRLERTKNSWDYTLSRRPLTIEYVYADRTEFYCSDPEHADNEPQIIVTTPARLANIVREPRAAGVSVVAVDDADVFVKVSCILNQELVSTKGAKSKYVNNLESSIRVLQESSIQDFIESQAARVKQLISKEETPRAISSPRTSIRKMLLDEKIEKLKRQVLYKPIQFCFIAAADPTHKEMLYTKSSMDQKNKNFKSISKELESLNSSKSNGPLAHLRKTYLMNKTMKDSRKGLEPITEFAQKIIRFDNDQRLVKRQEKALIKAGSYVTPKGPLNSYSNVCRPEVIISVCESGPKDTIQLKNLDIVKNSPGHKELAKQMDEHVSLARNNVKNMDKQFLKYASGSDQKSELEAPRNIAAFLLQFEKSNQIIDGPLMIIVPSSFCVEKICKSLNAMQSTSRFELVDSSHHIDDFFEGWSQTNPKILVTTASQLIGSSVKRCSNMLIYSIQSLLPETAFGGTSTNDAIRNINGIIDPCADLISFYLFKLITCFAESPKRLILLLDNCNKKKLKIVGLRTSQEMKRLSQMIMYNDIEKCADIKSISDESVELKYGIDADYVSALAVSAEVTAKSVSSSKPKSKSKTKSTSETKSNSKFKHKPKLEFQEKPTATSEPNRRPESA